MAESRWIVFDPGVVTGWAVMAGRPKTEALPRLIASGEAHTLFTAAATLVREARKHSCTTVVIENFVPTRKPMTKAMILTCQVVGALRLTAALLRLSVVFQAPSARARFRKRVADVFSLDTSSRHILDAVAHGWRYFVLLKRRK